MEEKKQSYVAPTVDFVKTEDEDVITTSPIELPIIPASYRTSDLYNF